MAEHVSLSLPIVPMRNAVLFPGVAFPISAGRPGTLRAIEAALADPERRVFAVAQRDDAESVSPRSSTRSVRSRRSARSSAGSAACASSSRASARHRAALRAEQARLPRGDRPGGARAARLDPRDPAFVALHREVRERAAELGKKRGVPDEAVEQMLAEVAEPGRLADLVAGYLDVPRPSGRRCSRRSRSRIACAAC